MAGPKTPSPLAGEGGGGGRRARRGHGKPTGGGGDEGPKSPAPTARGETIQRRRSGRGFTLLEVLIAFVILAVSLSVILQVFSSGMRGARLAGAYTTATLLAKSVLAETGIETPLEEGEVGGEFDNGFRWRRIVTLYEDEAMPEALGLPVAAYRVTVEVSWDEGGRSVSLETIRLRPPEGRLIEEAGE